MIHSNIVPKKELREIQLKTLKILRDALICSFGPMGSNSAIKKQNAFTKYTKDGHSILSDINFTGPIEFAVKEDLEELTRHIVKTVGDGTTSAVILSALIFEEMLKLESDMTPFEIIRTFKNCVSKITEEIMKYKQETTVDDIYKIAYVATNGNEKIAANIREIYREYGNNVYIDVNISNTTEDLVKTYDGMTIESGYSDSCYINQGDGTCRINNARVYVFEDPIDTPEQATFLDIIVNNNIYSAENKEHLIPTVIMAPKVSKDMAAYLGQLCQYMASADIHKRPPFLLITNIYDADQFMDIATLCGAKTIKKYSDFKLQEMNIQKGLAPTPETIIDFCGLCETVEASNSKTKFIKPKLMFDENGEHTKLFKGMIEYLEAELSTAYDQGKDAKFVFSLKKRLNSLKSNMVEYLVGGVSASDRDSERDLVEDAVLNCRSAAKDGFGYGANFEGLRASNIIEWHTINEKNINDIIARAYLTLTSLLYQTSGIGEVKANNLTMESLNTQKSPYNLRTGKFDKEVLSSINSDIVILETISKIVTLMFTCNQFLCPTPAHNTYVNPE